MEHNGMVALGVLGRGQRPGRGRGRGRGAAQGTREDRSKARGDDELSGYSTIPTDGSEHSHASPGMTPTASEIDASSASESQVTPSESSRRYPLRSSRARAKVPTAFDLGADYDVHDDEQPIQKRSHRKKPATKVSRKGGRSSKPGKVPRLTERLQHPLSSDRRSHQQVATPAMAQNHLNPIFLRMAHWISANPTKDAADEAHATVDVRVLGNDPEGVKVATETLVPLESTSQVMESDDESHEASNTDTAASLFRFIPSSVSSSLHRKRHRSGSGSRLEPQRKVFCAYPGQSIRNQASYLPEWESDSDATQGTWQELQPDRQSTMNSSILFPLEHLELETAISQNLDESSDTRNANSDSAETDDVDNTPRAPQKDLPVASPLTESTNTSERSRTNDVHENHTNSPSHYESPVSDNTSCRHLVAKIEKEMDIETEPDGIAEQEGSQYRCVPLMEYSHNELVTDAIRNCISDLGKEVDKCWMNTWPEPNEMGAPYILESFRNLQVPILLFSPHVPANGMPPPQMNKQHSARVANTYLTIATYFHLLGLRAVTAARTGEWCMTANPGSPCTLGNFTLQLSAPHAPHNQQAREIFISHFIQSTHAKLYSITCITGALFREDRISRAFDHALRVQVQIQRLGHMDKSYQEIHKQERCDASKLGKWLLLHQAIRMTHKMEVAALVARIGPGLCSSDESDLDTDMDDSMAPNETQLAERLLGSGIQSWRGAAFVTCLTALRTKGLYYGRQVSRSRPSRQSKKPPPDGTPFSWISDEYVESQCSI